MGIVRMVFQSLLGIGKEGALSDFTSPVDESFKHLYYLYQKSSKKLQVLKCLYQAIKGDFEMYGEGVKPLKAIGTRWIDHRIRAMGRLDDKVGLYARHMKSLLTRKRTRKQK